MTILFWIIVAIAVVGLIIWFLKTGKKKKGLPPTV